MRRWWASPWALALGGLLLPPLLALLTTLTALHARVDAWLQDANHRLVARERYFRDTLVVEIDEASLAELQPYFGKWPYGRNVYALLLDYLGEHQARAVFFDILFADARSGDREFRTALARNPQAILAASALREPIAGESDADLLARLAWPFAAGAEAPRAAEWPALALPLPLLGGQNALPRVGVISFKYDEDGVLRRLPLLHRIDNRTLPSAVLAALAPEGAERGVAAAQGGAGLRVGERSWPVDREGAVGLVYPANANSVLTMPLSRLAKAALGKPGSALDKDLFKGKTVFVGSTTLFSDQVNTPYGILNGIHVLAIAFATLNQGLAFAPRHPAWDLTLLAIALAAPATIVLRVWRRRPLPGPGVCAAIAAAAAAAVYALHLCLLAGHQATWLAAPLLAALTAGVLAVLQTIQAAAGQRVAQQQETVALVSHELKTPLAVIDLTLQNLDLEDNLPPAVAFRHRKLRRASRNLQALIQHHLAEDRLRRGQPLRMETVDMGAILTEVAEAADYPGLSLDLGSAESMFVRGDQEMLRVAVSNLVGNAVKYSPDGGPISLIADREDGLLRIRVCDQGIGIETADLARIFDPYARVDGVRQPGSGLGLHLVRQIVERHGGRIEVQSQPGVGSTFTVHLPAESRAGNNGR